ncbi:SlyX family protein [Salinimonas chungwhensis]|uniref:SlyX family protein n=1 Tax=Salinimonas chungwhensis TaxID=265425 RepID=UPI0003619487|nr:SlyX family protein [Salinimonas chungwhensis]
MSSNDTTSLTDAYNAIEELQTKVAFQEHTIDELNDALTGQQHQIEKLQIQIRHLMEKIKTMEPSDIARLSDETPPPHY